MSSISRLSVVAATGVAALAVSSCQSTHVADLDGAVPVASNDQTCDVAATEAPSGVVRFNVTNTGGQVTEFYVLAHDGLQVLGEVENISPGLTRDLVVQLPPGQVTLACKPGMVGDGIRSGFTITESGTEVALDSSDQALIDEATSQYAAYVKDQTEQLLTDTKAFAAAYIAGDDDLTRELYAPTRMHWERIEPVAESFGDLDPILDAREADLEPGQKWTGWHRIEKDLWPPANDYTPLTPTQRRAVADRLVADTTTLYDRTRDMQFQADQLGNGAKELLDEVATGKITGEEETWSHTDLWDFQANLEGAKVMYAGLRPVVKQNNPQLATTLDEQFANTQQLLDRYRDGDGFVLYTELTAKQVKEMAEAVDALGEPLSQLTTSVLLGSSQQ